ncbi:UNVERIFIED_CONTAM: hypothetical protein HDU68_008107 [Siphonaria sp. JEL0065]|nr:hypothetical protein HDU68_008107 [Siphonaria sp. JEL0065]
MAFWEFLPSYVTPLLSAISVLCLVNDRSGRRPHSAGPQILQALGSAKSGVGLFSLTLDWSLVSSYSPITTPLWASINQFAGLYFFLWILTPLLWSFNAFGIDRKLGTSISQGPNGTQSTYPLGFALNSPDIFNKNGTMISLLRGLNLNNNAFDFNVTHNHWNRTSSSSNLFNSEAAFYMNTSWYDSQKPIHVTTSFAVSYISAFAVFSSCIIHVLLWYGEDIWYRINSKPEDLDTDDIHAVLMDVYPKIPAWWNIALFLTSMAGMILVCHNNQGFALPWYGVLLAAALAVACMIPIGIINAISGQKIELKAMGEIVGGFVFQGRIVSVAAFRTFSSCSLAQALLLVNDMKLAHYVKIPPLSLFIAQLSGSVLGAIISTSVAWSLPCGMVNY